MPVKTRNDTVQKRRLWRLPLRTIAGRACVEVFWQKSRIIERRRPREDAFFSSWTTDAAFVEAKETVCSVSVGIEIEFSEERANTRVVQRTGLRHLSSDYAMFFALIAVSSKVIRCDISKGESVTMHSLKLQEERCQVNTHRQSLFWYFASSGNPISIEGSNWREDKAVALLILFQHWKLFFK